MASRLSPKERAAIADAAVEEARASQGEAALTESELADMSLDELLAYFAENGVDVDIEKLEAQVRASMGDTLVDVDRGNMDEHKRAAVEERARRAMADAAKSVARQTIRQLSDAAMAEGDDRPPSERYSMWVCICGPTSCDSCIGRHKVIDSEDSWQGDSPGDGTTACGDKCRCRKIPVNAGRGDEGLRAA